MDVMGKGRDRGSATIWTVALMALVFAVAMAVAFAGTARVARHRAQGAADLSALAAARLAFVGSDRGCAEAASIAAKNGSAVTRCSVGDDGVVEIEVAMKVALPLKGRVVMAARARAGPVHVTDPDGWRRTDEGESTGADGRARTDADEPVMAGDEEPAGEREPMRAD
ncbi:Rv3654c family TadE-like protein [Streptosporangium sp. NPDC050855]|uniref:Rv3654c family TadE-like protein n=1 Tax=Streptosporangium sp. NPDC050855 TaxID=3366194 RepID=UPI0037AD3A74